MFSNFWGYKSCEEHTSIKSQKRRRKILMKYFKTLVLVLSLPLLIGTAISPKFCEKHQVDDYCWIEEDRPYGGTETTMED